MSKLKVEGKVSDWCPKCKNCKAVTRIHDGKTASIRIIEVDCEDPYDGMVKTLDVDSDICCSMFEMKPDMPCDKISSLEDELKETKDALYKTRVMYSVENKRFDRLDTEFLTPLVHVLYPGEEVCKPYSEILEDIKKMCNYENELLSLKTINKGLTDKIGKLTNKIVTQQSTHYKQCARILDLENMVSKLQSGEYDDILAKDIEIKSLQDKYEAAMTGWKDAIDTNDKMIGEKDKQIEELTHRYNTIAKKLNDIHDILKEDPNNA